MGRTATALSKRRQFDAIVAANELNLEFGLNKNELPTLRSVFARREYSDWFPFYENAVVLDVGAHYGYFSIFASRKSCPGRENHRGGTIKPKLSRTLREPG